MESLTGQQVQALAYAQAPIVPHGLAADVQTVAIFLLVLSVSITGTRLTIRGWRGKFGLTWGADDHLAVIAILLYIAASAFLVLSCHFGLSTRDTALNDLVKIRGAEYLSYWQMTYILSACFTKASIALALMRLSPDGRYHYPLWGTIVVNFGSSVGGLVAVFTNCEPLQATWNPLLGQCGSKEKVAQISLIVSVFQIVTDWLCALLPLVILQGLQIPKRRKISILCLLGLGGFASIATLLRIPYFQYYTMTEDYLYNVAMTCLWSMVETAVGLVACSLPSLRKLIKFSSFSETGSRGTYGRGSKSCVSSGLRGPTLSLSKLDKNGRKSEAKPNIQDEGKWSQLDDDVSTNSGPRRWGKLGV